MDFFIPFDGSLPDASALANAMSRSALMFSFNGSNRETIDPVSVMVAPEPSSLTLVVIGLGAAGLRWRRRSREN
jgi:hypothetical protein